MIRSLAAVIAGHFSIVFLNGFSRLAIAHYSLSEVQLTGISHLPSAFWKYIIVGLGLVFGTFGGLITCSIIQKNYGTETLVLSSLIIMMGLIDYQFLKAEEPDWYLLIAPLIKTAGVWLGYRIKRLQDRKLYTNTQQA